MANPITTNPSVLRSFVPVGSRTTLNSLSTSNQIQLTGGATGILIQAFTEDVHFAIGDDDTVTATTSDFKLSTEAVAPILLELVENTYIAFIENTSSATLAAYIHMNMTK